jgi:hypothetical protein
VLKLLIICVLAVVPVLSGCSKELSPEEKSRLDALKTDLTLLKSDIAQAEIRNASLAGGLLKSLIEMRLEVLKTTEALLQQRIHSIESGATITVKVTASQVDPKRAEVLAQEMTLQEAQLKTAQLDAARSGGMIGIMKQMTVATHEQSLAMLRTNYLSAKHGLGIPLPIAPPSHAKTDISRAEQPSVALVSNAQSDPKLVDVRLVRKQFTKQDYQDYVFFDIEYTAKGLDKSTRAIKGTLHLQDLFGESKMNLSWTIDKPLAPGGKIVEKGTGFKYNQFTSEHQWVKTSELANMTASFTVRSILYADGTRQDF